MSVPSGSRPDRQLAGRREHRRRRRGKSGRHRERAHRHRGGHQDGAGCQGAIDRVEMFLISSRSKPQMLDFHQFQFS